MAAPVFQDDANLISWWRLEEATGATRLDSAGSNDLADTGSVVQSVDHQEGSYSADFEADGADKLSISDAGQSGLAITGNLTICAWIKLESLANRCVASKYNAVGNQRGYSLYVKNASPSFPIETTISSNGTATVVATGATSLSTGTWHHVVLVYNGVDIRLYLNGALDTNGANNPKAYSSGIFDNTAEFALGTISAGSYLFDGLIDDVMVFDRACSAAEILSIYTYGLQTRPTPAGTLTTAGALARGATRSAAGALTTAGALLGKAGKALSGTLASAGALATVYIQHASAAGTLMAAGTVEGKALKSLAGALTTAGALARRATKSAAGGLVGAGALTKIYIQHASLAGALATAGAVVARISGKTGAGALASSGGLSSMLLSWSTTTVRIRGKLEVEWDGVAFTDESENLLACSGVQAISPFWQSAGAGGALQPEWSLVANLANTGDRYSATNTGGALYADIGADKGKGKRVKFSAGLWNGSDYTYTQVFAGYIDDLRVTSTRNDMAVMVCKDNRWPLLQHKATTTMYADQRADEWLGVLANEAGLTDIDFDPGLRIIPWCWADEENLWTEMNKVAASEGGLLFFDRDGTLVFENAEAWAGDARHNTSQHTFTVSRFKDLSVSYDWANVYNRVEVERSPRAARGTTELYSLSEDFWILAGETKTLTCVLRYPSVAVYMPAANVDYHIVNDVGEDLSASVDVTATKYAQRVELEFTNNHAYDVATLYDLSIRGVPLIGYPAGHVTLDAADSDIGDPASGLVKAFPVARGNEYIQTESQARLLAGMLRDRMKKCRATFGIQGLLIGKPSLIPGDLVTIVEADSGINHTAYVTSIRWSYAAEKGAYSFTQVTAVAAGNWYPYSDYFTLGISTLSATSDRVFY